MIEQLAQKFITLPALTLSFIFIGIWLLAGLAAWGLDRRQYHLLRAPYFALTGLIVLAVSLTNLAWSMTVDAMLGGYLWLLVAISVSATIVAGCLSANIASARSRDAFGSKKMAFLTFVPVANLWLLFTRSRSDGNEHAATVPRLLQGDAGVLVGVVASASALLAGLGIEPIIMSRAKAIENDPSSETSVVDMLLATQGLEGALHTMASGSQPVKIDEMTTLTRLEARGTELCRVFVVSDPAVEVSEESKRASIEFICAYPALLSLLRAGASIREHYLLPDGSTLSDFSVAEKDC